MEPIMVLAEALATTLRHLRALTKECPTSLADDDASPLCGYCDQSLTEHRDCPWVAARAFVETQLPPIF